MVRVCTVVVAVVLVLAGCGGSTKKASSATTVATTATLPRPVTTVAPLTMVAPSAASTQPLAPTTTAKRTPAATTAPKAHASTTVSAVNLCGAPANPMGYNLCGRGQHITKADARTCTYFKCISNFASGTGYMIQCVDGTYSMSGGKTGSCSTHGGPGKTVSSGP
jgi:hypothetical protein